MKKPVPIHKCLATPKPMVEYYYAFADGYKLPVEDGWYVYNRNIMRLAKVNFCPECGQKLDHTPPKPDLFDRVQALEL